MNDRVAYLGDRYYIGKMKDLPVYGFFFDANRWKTWLHEGLALTFDRRNLETARGGITIFVATDPNEHLSFAST